MKTTRVTKAIGLCYALILQILFLQSIAAQQNNPFQLISDGDFERFTPQTIYSIANFVIRKDNHPQLFAGSTQLSTGTHPPHSFCGTDVPHSWNGNANNKYVMLYNGLSSDPQIAVSGISFPLNNPAYKDSLYQFSLKVLSRCNRKINIVFSKSAPCELPYGPDNSDPTTIVAKMQNTACLAGNSFNIVFDTSIVINGSNDWEILEFTKRLPNESRFVTIYSEADQFTVGSNQALDWDSYFIDDVGVLALGALLAAPFTCPTTNSDPCNLVCFGDLEDFGLDANNPNFVKATNMRGSGSSDINTPDIVLDDNTDKKHNNHWANLDYPYYFLGQTHQSFSNRVARYL